MLPLLFALLIDIAMPPRMLLMRAMMFLRYALRLMPPAPYALMSLLHFLPLLFHAERAAADTPRCFLLRYFAMRMPLRRWRH